MAERPGETQVTTIDAERALLLQRDCVDEQGKIPGIDPLLGMGDFEASPSGEGPTLLALLAGLTPPATPGA